MHFLREDLVGSVFIAFGVTLFVGFFYAAVVSKLLPPYENRLLAAIQNDLGRVCTSRLSKTMLVLAVHVFLSL